jgi:thiol-disulfide isomerase/thioredoxin
MKKSNSFLFFLLILILFSIYNKNRISKIPNINIPKIPETKEITETIFYDEYEKAKKISIESNKKLILIFGADWCPYCKELKKNVSQISNFKYYIVCFINSDKNKNIVSDYKIKSLPTSIIIYQNIEEVTKIGYSYDDYQKWLFNNKEHGKISWTKF